MYLPNTLGSSLPMTFPKVYVYDTNEMAKPRNPVLRRISLKIPEKFQSPLTFRVETGRSCYTMNTDYSII